MALREDIVASATQFLQDPSVAASSLENRIAFLRSKHLTQEEIDASLSRAGQNPFTQVQHHHPQPVHQPHQNGGPHSPQYPPYGWQSSLAQETRRDWRDWFIMATVVGGVGFGLYELGKVSQLKNCVASWSMHYTLWYLRISYLKLILYSSDMFIP
jgi:peroxin-14